MELSVAPGTLLAAWPDLRDPNFMHSVVLMCQHGESGAYGLVVNRPTELTVADLFPEHALLGELAFPVHLGGPVDHETLQFVHRVPDEIPGGLELGDGVFLGREVEQMHRAAPHQRGSGDHLGVKQRARRQQPVQVAAMPVGPVHHGCHGKP